MVCVCVRAWVFVCVCAYVHACVCVTALSKCLTAVCVLLMGVVQVGFQVPTPSPSDTVQPHLWGTSLPQMESPALDLSAWVVPRHPSVSMGRCDRLVAARDFAFCFVCVTRRHIKRLPQHKTKLSAVFDSRYLTNPPSTLVIWLGVIFPSTYTTAIFADHDISECTYKREDPGHSLNDNFLKFDLKCSTLHFTKHQRCFFKYISLNH